MMRRYTLTSRDFGPLTIGVLVVADAALWLLAQPGGETTSSFIGQLIGAESILLLSIALVLISTLPWVETWFDGIDRAAIAHRMLAITGVALLIPHIILAKNPHSGTLGKPLSVIGTIGLLFLLVWAIVPRWRSMVPRPLHGVILATKDAPGVRRIRRVFGGYERWRALHRLTGVFVAVGFVHGVLDGTPFNAAPVLRWSYILIGGTGLAFYAYRELLARHFHLLRDYQVSTVQRVDSSLVEVTLAPLGPPIAFTPGQFTLIYLEGKDGWARHPFTIASAPDENLLRLTITAAGDYTAGIDQNLAPGMPAVVAKGLGHFSHDRGTARQVWIAGGAGITPFLSWMRAAAAGLPPQVDLFYSSRGPAPYGEELQSIADHHETVRVHLIDTTADPRLTTERILAETGAAATELSVFMCGPDEMLRSLQRGLQKAGIPGRRIYREHFNWR